MLQDKLLDAAVAHFGEAGFEGASTRAIAKASGTAMSSITYHFGSKEGLYLAAADHIAKHIRERMRQRLSAPAEIGIATTREEAIGKLLQMLDAFAELMLDPASASWCRYIVREQQAPTAAFERLYEGAMRAMVEGALALTRVARPDLSDREARVLAIQLYGSCMILRVGRASVMRMLDVADIGDEDAALLRHELRRTAETLLRGEQP